MTEKEFAIQSSSGNLFRAGCASATWIKGFALLCMTIDHIGALGFDTPGITGHQDTLRLIGRMAAPLFLYFVVESARHTKNRKRYLLRLYLAAVCTGLCNLAVSRFLFSGRIALGGNILHSFVWVVAAICVLDMALDSWRRGRRWRACLWLAGGAGAVLLTSAYENLVLLAPGFSRMFGGNAPWMMQLSDCFLRSPVRAEYSVLYIVLGIVWYYQRTKAQRCLTLLGLSLLSFFAGGNVPGWCVFIEGIQWGMAGAIVPILLYNGTYGRGHKWFFYLYYPLHQYVLAFLLLC